MKFKVGDKVRIKSLKEIKNLPNHSIRGGDIEGYCEDTDELGNVITVKNTFLDLMFGFCGKETVVEQVEQTDEECNYRLADTNGWGFIACWLELAQHYVKSFDEE